MPLRRNLLLVVMGGIAAYKIPQLCRLLRHRGFKLRVIMTKNAARFVTSEALAHASNSESGITHNLAVSDELSTNGNSDECMAHIELARWAQIVLIAPATANGLAKLAHGICDDLASTTLIALKREVPIFVAPAMNPQMWQNHATIHNNALLQARGVKMIGPCFGATACGEVGLGRMREPVDIATEIELACTKEKLLDNTRILITAGPTIEPIDPVRYLSNRSSGRQGYALAQAFAERGAQVILVVGATTLPAPVSPSITVIRAQSAAEMAQACMDCLTDADTANGRAKKSTPVQVAIFAAAVADFRPKKQFLHKPPKKMLEQKIDLIENKDILAAVANLPQGMRPQLVIGFAAETSLLTKEKLRAKQKAKNCDWLVANDVLHDAVFNSDYNRVQIIDKKGECEALPRMSKRAVAEHIAEKVSLQLNDPKGLTAIKNSSRNNASARVATNTKATA